MYRMDLRCLRRETEIDNYIFFAVFLIDKKPCFRYFKEEPQQVSVRVEPSIPYCDILIQSPSSHSLDVAVTQGFSDPRKCTISYAAELGGEIAETECNVQVLSVPEDKNRLYYAVHHLRDGNRKTVVLNVTPVKSTRKLSQTYNFVYLIPLIFAHFKFLRLLFFTHSLKKGYLLHSLSKQIMELRYEKPTILC